MAIVFALITLFGWASGDVFVTLTSRKIGSLPTYFYGFVVTLILTSLYIPFAGPIVDYRIFGLAILLNLVHTVGNIAFFKGLEIGNASLTASIAEAFPILTVLISLTYFKESLVPFQVLGIVFILIGIFLSSLKFDELITMNVHKILSDKGVKFALVALVGWGIFFAFVRIPAEKIGWFWAEYPLYFISLPLIFSKKIRNAIPHVLRTRSILLSIMIFAILVTVADFSYNFAILSGFTSVVAPITGCTPVVFCTLAAFIFRDKLTKQQKLGIFSSLLGIVLVSFAG